jgi:UrcA family protein
VRSIVPNYDRHRAVYEPIRSRGGVIGEAALTGRAPTHTQRQLESPMFNTLRRRALCIVCCTTGLVALGADLPVFASPPTRLGARETTSSTISLSGLDLTTPNGQHEARARLAEAAQHLCRQWADERKVDNWAIYSDCTQESLLRALRQLPSASLDAFK